MRLLLGLFTSTTLLLSAQVKAVEGNDYWDAIASTVQTTGFNGTIIVANGDRILLHRSVGFADDEQTVPLSVNHRFSPGSVGKEFTTISIMQLVAANKLSYQDKITDYIDDLPAWAGDITIEQVLTHTSGLGNVAWKRHIDTEDALQQIRQGQLLFEPGSDYHYTNLNVVVRALVIENITGQSYADYIVDSIFEVAGMTHSFHQTQSVSEFDTVVSGDYPTNMAGLTIYVTPLDLLKFEYALWDGSLVDTDQLTEVIAGDRLSGQTNRAYFDFGKFLLDGTGALVSWEHDGSNPRHHTIKHHDFTTGNIFILMSSDGNKSTLYKLLRELQTLQMDVYVTDNNNASKSTQATAHEAVLN